MSAHVSRKRARTEVQEDAATEAIDDSDAGGQPVRDEEYWFEDGTIILLAGNVEFKVYACLLVKHSPVFKDMLSLPQPEDASSNPVRPPTVRLEDFPDDLKYVFEVIMPANALHPFGFPKVDHDRLSAWIRIGIKYQIDGLVQEALEYLRQVYPDDLDVYWRENRTERAKLLSPIGIVNLARLTGALDLLPVALMDCCQMESGIVEGFQRGDGTFERLSDHDLELCFKARDKLIEEQMKLLHQLLDIRAPSLNECQDSDCEDEINIYWRSLVSVGLCAPTPLGPWVSSIKTNMPELCSECRTALVDRAVTVGRDIFSRLPDIMGVVVEDWGKMPSPSTT
ncbi:hypothetical protein L226DRAFT_572898 [Lentinus tigrinus ALCF2SS1-7]|uniref:BTB domain-containing protein n=1 Tax=Lentinus tigrinus ALCF2SS1-6 TaxID=1328759 RepID=A0A5C2S4U7_9APHY|nr:hypothetical protein L227DRAFT_505003 [Lentinus tigrinus ALCF2SS1-6]RPD72793.1 hypothetical protein L226DRAFT_572898 [Lentinus tigrinus ALCF2SS1-7]